MFEDQIKQGRDMIRRLKINIGLSGRAFDVLPEDSKVRTTEVRSWEEVIKDAIIQVFGEKSNELKRWNQTWSDYRKHSQQYSERWGLEGGAGPSVYGPTLSIERISNQIVLLQEYDAKIKMRLKISDIWSDEREIDSPVPVPERYVDFDLHIGPGGHAVASSIEGRASAKIPTEVPKNILLSLKLIEKRATDADLLKKVGQTLYDWLFPGPIHTHFQQTEAVARRDDTKMRLRLRIEAEEIASLPLEFLYREIGGYYMAVNPDTVLSRYLNLPVPPGYVRRREGALHLLAIIADPSDQVRLPPDEWETIIKEALAGPLANGQMTLQTVKRATRKEIRNALLQQKPDIIQFVGHGIYKNGKGYLALVDEDTDETWLVDDERFANLYLGHDDHLGLISLATCESAKSDDPQGFLGIAPKLVQRGVPAVLSMQYEVYVKTAKIFLEDFYTFVAARKPVDWATQSARNAISQELGFGNREFATPVLYMRAKDGTVFNTLADRARTVPEVRQDQKLEDIRQAVGQMQHSLEGLSAQKTSEEPHGAEQPRGAELILEMAIRGKPQPTRGGRVKLRLDVAITSGNAISSENGALKLTVALPVVFSESTQMIFRAAHFETSTGLYLPGYDDVPRAQSMKIRWAASQGTVIFPGDWHNFYGNPVSLDIPNPSLLPNPVYLLFAKLFTVNSPAKEILYSIQLNAEGDFEIGEVSSENYPGLAESFWATYHLAREKPKN